MKNLENNKLYNLSRLVIWLIAMASFVTCLIRMFFPILSKRLNFAGSFVAWTFMDQGYMAYVKNQLPATLVKLLATTMMFILIYVVLWLASKKSVYFMIGALVYYLLDSLLFAYDSYLIRSREYFIFGVTFKSLVILSMAVGIYYGFVGRRVEQFAKEEEREIAPDIKFTNKSFSYELAEQKRTITFKREKRFIMSYIYIEIIVDGRHKAYLEDGEEVSIELDGNKHLIELISRYALIKRKAIFLSQGNEAKQYDIAIKFKNPIIKRIIVQ